MNSETAGPANQTSGNGHDVTTRGLTREMYLSEEVFARETEILISRSWLYAGHVSQLASVGDYVLRAVGRESIIVVRSEADRISAFFNVCRHRGSRVCDAESGHLRSFVCPYHQWNYALDGRLRSASGMRENGVPFSDLSLSPVQLEVIHGLIFINLDGAAAPLVSRLPTARSRGTLGFPGIEDADLARVQPEQTKIASERTYRMNANWKLVTENLLECYHCPGSHPEFSRVCDVSAMYQRYEARETRGPDSSPALPLRGGMGTLTIDGKPVCAKPLGQPGDDARHGYSVAFLILPIACTGTYFVDYGVLFDVRPVSTEQTDFVCQWFVHQDAVEGQDYRVEELIELWDVTTEQDVALCERQQDGVASRSYVPGPINLNREPGIGRFLQTYRSAMTEGAAQVT